MLTTVNLISSSSQSSHTLDNYTICSVYHGNSRRAVNIPIPNASNSEKEAISKLV
ncbi:hypothetical protein [Hyella patelloides]|uniref:hypothetical protein n=1 Tax=Hyella patelloides TaxID=1982969 RepID=UPI0016437996|nr:hypothetical protein [Hyella patelloides]